MCGIVGVVGKMNAVDVLVNGLRKLEYRGYDSAGIFVSQNQSEDYLVKAVGKIEQLAAQITPEVRGVAGIGHTRWATHGVPTLVNAHPHQSNDGRFLLVHNGVITNFTELKATYLPDVLFKSATDTEVIVQLIAYFSEKEHLTTKSAFKKVLALLEGSYALILMDRTAPETLWVAKNKSPLLIGLGDNFNVITSDALAMLEQTSEFVELHDDELVEVTATGITIENQFGEGVERASYQVELDQSDLEKGAYPYYMLKEIDEQPSVLRRISAEYLSETSPIMTPEILGSLAEADRVYIVAAGTSYHAGLIGKTFFEKLAGIPTEVHVASEFGYHLPLLSAHPFFIFITQSGETADSRQVLVKINQMNYPSLTLTNNLNATIPREATYKLPLLAGPEIAVASTKAYSAQVAVQFVLAQALGRRKKIAAAEKINVQQALSLTAEAMQTVIDEKEKLQWVTEQLLVKTRNAFYLGRGTDYFVALEAALKLKEISYIQTEGFPAGELKHGTIALVEEKTPILAIMTEEKTVGHTRGNIQEVKARGAQVLTIVSENLAAVGDQIVLPVVSEYLTALVAVVPAQLIAYYATLQRGYDVDQPRNLAKSVTVE